MTASETTTRELGDREISQVSGGAIPLPPIVIPTGPGPILTGTGPYGGDPIPTETR